MLSKNWQRAERDSRSGSAARLIIAVLKERPDSESADRRSSSTRGIVIRRRVPNRIGERLGVLHDGREMEFVARAAETVGRQ